MTTGSIAPTTAMRAHAQALLAEPTWARGTDRRTSRAFVAFAGSKGEIHRADVGACTCRGFYHRGICAHVVAIRERAQEESLAVGLCTEAESDCGFAAVAADHEAQADAERRRRSAETFERLFPANDFD